MIAHQSRVSYVIVFHRTCDLAADEEPLTIVENEASNLLSQCGHPGDATSVVLRSVLKALGGYREWKAKIIELKRFLDSYISESENAI